MKFLSVKESDFKTICSDKELKKFNKLTEKGKKTYLLAYSLYRKLFTEYIIEKINLKKYDEKLQKSKLNFWATEKKSMDFYQYFSSETLQYFYLRNNIHIGKLDEDEKEFLKKRVSEKNYELDDRAKIMIETTYPKVIFEDIMENGDIYEVAYGPQTSSFMANNNSLVIGLRYNEFGLNEDTDDEDNDYDDEADSAWEDLFDKQQLYLLTKLPDARLKMEEKLSIPLVMFKYNEYSVIPRKLEQE